MPNGCPDRWPDLASARAEITARRTRAALAHTPPPHLTARECRWCAGVHIASSRTTNAHQERG